MPITARCPGCGKNITGPDSAVGRRAKCPDCGAVVTFTAGRSAVDELAAAVQGGAAPALASAGADSSPPASALAATATAEKSPPPSLAASTPPTPSRLGPSSKSTRATTVIGRLATKTSPYGTLRLLSVVTLVVGVVLAAIAALAGIAGLIMISMQGQPLIGVGVFLGCFAVAAILFLAGKIGSEMLRLWADVGDRARQITQLLEELASRDRDDTL